MLQQAVALHQQGQYLAAEDLYQQVLQIQPDHFDALHLLGVAARQRGDADTAIMRIRQAIVVNPRQAIAYCNLGAALQDLGKPQDALESYDRALQLQPDYAMAWNNRGNTLRCLGQSAAALHSYDQALRVQPDYAEALLNRGIALQGMDEHEQALDDFELALHIRVQDAAIHFARAVSLQYLHDYDEAITGYDLVLTLQTNHADAWFNRGICQHKLNQPAAALQSFEAAIEIRAGFSKAYQHKGNVLRLLGRTEEAVLAYQFAATHCRHKEERAEIDFALAALGATEPPPMSPISYVTDLFNQYAGHFDQHLINKLDYHVPQFIADAIDRHRSRQPGASLDLGCGTGLCGPYLRPYSTKLTGVDLSEKMLDRAGSTGMYDELHCQEIGTYLQQLEHRFELIVAADVFVYIGDLTVIFTEVSRVLQSGGLFAFSVESCDQKAKDYTLSSSQRYAHSCDYLQRLAMEHGFIIAEARQETARKDKGADVLIHILILVRQ